MQPKIGFSLQKHYTLPLPKVIARLCEAGFSAVSPVWTPELDLSAIAASVREMGMTIQSLHGPTRDVPLLWCADAAASAAAKSAVLRSIDDCARFQIPILVMHGWQGLNYSFCEDKLFFENFDHIVAHAQARGVSIAFENLEGEEFLAALMARYRSDANVGFCWDSGHDHCYPHKRDFLAEFGDRLMMTHLNDNLGLHDPSGLPTTKNDLHYLPYDGNIDWEQNIRRLKKARKVDTLNFELKNISRSDDPKDHIYAHVPLAQYLAEAGRRAMEIAKKYEGGNNE